MEYNNLEYSTLMVPVFGWRGGARSPNAPGAPSNGVYANVNNKITNVLVWPKDAQGPTDPSKGTMSWACASFGPVPGPPKFGISWGVLLPFQFIAWAKDIYL